jgi:hypothetical protein
MIDHNIIDKQMEQTLYITYLASMFRSVRFGITEAHGKGVAMQFNYLSTKARLSMTRSQERSASIMKSSRQV